MVMRGSRPAAVAMSMRVLSEKRSILPRISASAPKTATSPIPAGSIVKVFEFVSAEGYLFARNEFGWFVTRQGTTWWVYGVSGATELCQDVPGWPPGLAPPADLVRGLVP